MRKFLSHVEFWIVLQTIAIAFVIVWLFFVTGARRRDAALHRGEVIADARSKVNQCLTSRPQLVKIDAFVHAVLEFHIATYVNALNLLAATPKMAPIYETRKENAERIRRTIGPVGDIHFVVPTVRQCLLLGRTRYGMVAPTVKIPSSSLRQQ